MSTRVNFTPEERESVISRYQAGESGQTIADTYSCQKTTIYRDLKKWGVATRSDTGMHFTDVEREEIVDRYVSSKQTAEHIAKSFSCGGATIIRSLTVWGIELRPRIPNRGDKGNKIYFTPEQRQQIISRYESGEWAKTIAPDYRCSAGTICNSLKDWGIELRKLIPAVRLSQKQIERMLQLYKEEKSLDEIVDSLGSTRIIITRHLRAQGAVIRRRGKPQKYFVVNGKKICSVCGLEKPCTEFGLHSSSHDGLQATCRACSAKRSRKGNLTRKFGITEDAYKAMWESQNGVCANCGEPETRLKFGKPTMLAVDHNHTTGAVRELICFRCNVVLGRIEESVVLCDKFKAYILKHTIGGNQK